MEVETEAEAIGGVLLTVLLPTACSLYTALKKVTYRTLKGILIEALSFSNEVFLARVKLPETN